MQPFSVLHSRCRQVGDVRLYFGRVTLNAERLAVRGLTWKGRFRRVIELRDVEAVPQIPPNAMGFVRVELAGGEAVSFATDAPSLWRIELEQRARPLRPKAVPIEEEPEAVVTNTEESTPDVDTGDEGSSRLLDLLRELAADVGELEPGAPPSQAAAGHALDRLRTVEGDGWMPTRNGASHSDAPDKQDRAKG